MLDILNSYEQRLQFTHELEIDNEISCLDVLLIRYNDKVKTNWYIKPTFSGRFLNYYSKHPRSQKLRWCTILSPGPSIYVMKNFMTET